MTQSKVVSKRKRPMMGTFVEISLYTDDDRADAMVTQAFDRGSFLEKVFSFHDSDSFLSRLNRNEETLAQAPEVFLAVYELAILISETSGNSFSIERDGKIDLSGLVKGAAVDAMVELLREGRDRSGLVNAGGDMRFFNTEDRLVNLRLGSFANPVSRSMKISKSSFATSSLSVSVDDPRSSTVYSKKLRAGLNDNYTVCVGSGACAIADALTKVALFGDQKMIEQTFTRFESELFVFDEKGELVESFI
jgi:thiamine biosynthesis lipoprotein ApbE